MKSNQKSLDNLKLAALKKQCCIHCNGSFSLTNIKKHENACKKNPKNLKIRDLYEKEYFFISVYFGIRVGGIYYRFIGM